MLGLVYILLSIFFGDRLSSIFFRFTRWPERLASAFLVGLLLSTWITYLSAAIFPWPFDPMIGGNLVFLIVSVLTIVLFRGTASRSTIGSEGSTTVFDLPFYSGENAPADNSRVTILGFKIDRSELWDWLTIILFAAFSTWMMFAAFGFWEDRMGISFLLKSDMGANLSIVQSFALGSNFPTEYPLFSGQPIRIHFLFWFQAGNLYYLGLHPIWGINLLSILSLTSLLTMIMSLGKRLFSSYWVGRVGAALFFFHGSLAYFYGLSRYGSFGDAIRGLAERTSYLVSGFDYHGEDWGLWTMNVYINQRHLIAAIGIFALVLVFWSRSQTSDVDEIAEKLNAGPDESKISRAPSVLNATSSILLSKWAAFVFSGLLIGLMPLWNGPVFLSAFMVFGLLLLFFRERGPLLLMLGMAIVTALPQLLFLRPGSTETGQSFPAFSWGLNIEPPTLLNIASYIGVTFGFKLLLIAIALFLANRAHRLLFVSLASLLAIAFTFKFSFEVLTNHKFISIWLVLVNLYVAYGLFRLWKYSVWGKIFAGVLLALIIPGGLIDLIPIHNAGTRITQFDKEPLVVWIKNNTEKNAVFLTEHYSDHVILFSGRRLFQGYTYFTAAAGYPADAREKVYRELYSSEDPAWLVELLNKNKIDYVVFDESLRKNHFKGQTNEAVYAKYFQLAFSDDEHRYEDLKIYKISEPLLPIEKVANLKDGASTNLPSMKGLAAPRGIAVDADGNYFVADTGNNRIVKFGSDGKMVWSYDSKGQERGELKDPNGIAVGASGEIYVTDAANNKLMKFDADGKFINEWLGPDGGFYGPRDIAIGPNEQLYIVDQGRTRIVRFDLKIEAFLSSWGTSGSGEGQFNEATGIAAGGGQVFVTDTGNERIEVFDLDGKYLRQWPVPEWAGFRYRYPDAVFDEKAKRLLVSNCGANDILAFDENGRQVDGIHPPENNLLVNPSSLAISDGRGGRSLFVVNTESARVSKFDLETKRK